MQTIVFGSGGLIGSSILKSVPGAKPFPKSIPWHDLEATEEMFDTWSVTEQGVEVIWAAGASVVSASKESTEHELKIFEAFIKALKRNSKLVDRVLLISSAGGVYGSNQDSKISEHSIPNPMSEYGRLKLAQEQALEQLASESEIRVVVARVSNAYGPMQNLNKKQGLISSLVKASLDRDLIEIYVPLDTKRDYIYSDDIGRKIAKLLEVTRSNDSPVIHKIIASQVNRTVSSVVAELNRIRGIRTPVIFATKRETFLQPRDLLFESAVFPEVETVSCISLAEGLQKVIANQLLTKQVGT